MISYQQFTSDFPEFASASQGSFSFFANYSSLMLNQSAWGIPAEPGQPNTLYDIGCELFIAHNLALSAQNQTAVASGSVPGQSSGPLSSEAADGVSASYDTTAGIEEGAGQWNLTTYGTRFIQMARLVGAAPTYVGPGGGACFGGAWQGQFLNFGWSVPWRSGY